MIAIIVRRAAKVVLCLAGMVILGGILADLPNIVWREPGPWLVLLWAAASIFIAVLPVPLNRPPAGVAEGATPSGESKLELARAKANHAQAQLQALSGPWGRS